MYKITTRQLANAKRLGISIKPSKVKGKKLDVFDKQGNKLASIGALGYMDYDLYLAKKGRLFADSRRKLYKIRHNADRHKKGSAGYYADQILW